MLLVNVLVVAVCALVYELLCGTLASYLLGDAVLQFSLVLGTYLFAMGVGAWLSKRLEARAASRYVQTELGLALVGGLSVPLLLAGVAAHVPLRPALYAVVFAVGALVGVELPLLVKILRAPKPDVEKAQSFGDVVARALAYDYVGALVASVLFPLVLVPRLGLVKTSVIAGGVNALVALSATFVVRVERPTIVRAVGTLILAVLAVTFVRGESWVAAATD
ncbi:MAG: Spermidine synthase [Labilithrix sp.]|nr:Spermidine synthase [Labilithrix sp.]